MSLVEKRKMELQGVNNLGKTFSEYIESIGQSRELSLAKTRIEEAIMWAEQHLKREAA